MAKNLKILGSGTSTGVPMIGCKCDVCKSTDPHNKRTRTSFYLSTKSGKKVLIDATPDLRTQLLRENIDHVDYVIITHDHADHVHGIDDLRPLTFSPGPKSIPVYTYKQCAQNLKKRFEYIFCDKYQKARPSIGGGIPKLELNIINIFNQEVEIHGDKFHFFLLPHGHTKTIGIYHDGLAILIDCNTVPGPVIEQLKALGIKLLIIDCVNYDTHKTHLTTETSFPIIDKIAPQVGRLIHMGHSLEHESLKNECSARFSFDVSPCFDGQELQW